MHAVLTIYYPQAGTDVQGADKKCYRSATANYAPAERQAVFSSCARRFCCCCCCRCRCCCFSRISPAGSLDKQRQLVVIYLDWMSV